MLFVAFKKFYQCYLTVLEKKHKRKKSDNGK